MFISTVVVDMFVMYLVYQYSKHVVHAINNSVIRVTVTIYQSRYVLNTYHAKLINQIIDSTLFII